MAAVLSSSTERDRSRSTAVAVAALVVALLACLLAGLVRPAQADEDGLFPLAVGDRVTVNVFGQPDLSGDYVIDGAGFLDMPLIGRLSVADLKPREAARRIRAALTNGYVRDASVSLRLTELKPIYVLGEIRAPGSYPFRHGLNVLGAVALAGGHRITGQPLGPLRADYLVAEERLRLLEVSQQALEAKRIRLEAQRDAKARLDFPEAWRTPRNGFDPSGLIAGEQEIFALQMAAQAGEIEMLRKQVARLEAEGRALAEQTKLEMIHVNLTQSQVEQFSKLAEAGHARRPVLVERQREEARARANLARIRAEVARNEVSLGELALRLGEVESNFQRRVVTELQETRQRLLETERSLPTAREIRDGRLRQLVAAGASPDGAAGWEMTIMRSRGPTMTVIQAGEGTLLQPGDIVRIAPSANVSRGAAGGAAAAGPEQAGQGQTFAATAR